MTNPTSEQAKKEYVAMNDELNKVKQYFVNYQRDLEKRKAHLNKLKQLASSKESVSPADAAIIKIAERDIKEVENKVEKYRKLGIELVAKMKPLYKFIKE